MSMLPFTSAVSLLGSVFLTLVVTKIAQAQEFDFSPKRPLSCELDSTDNVHCHFSLPKSSEPVHLKDCHGSYCVEASVQAHDSLDDSNGEAIVVGTQRYERPFKSLPREIAHVLQKWPTTWSSTSDQAKDYMDLGLAHQRLLELDPELPFELATHQVTLSINALQQAVILFQSNHQVYSRGRETPRLCRAWGREIKFSDAPADKLLEEALMIEHEGGNEGRCFINIFGYLALAIELIYGNPALEIREMQQLYLNDRYSRAVNSRAMLVQREMTRPGMDDSSLAEIFMQSLES